MTNKERFLVELRNRNYAGRTISMYMSYLDKYLVFCGQNGHLDNGEQIALFLSSRPGGNESRRLAWCAILAFYRFVLKTRCPYTLSNVRSRKRLPVVLPKNDIKSLLDAISNIKHRTMISLLYGSGLRVSEVVSLKCGHIGFSDASLRIVNAKQHKDRMTLLPGSLVPVLMEFCEGKSANAHVFLTVSGKPYTVRTVQAVFSKALISAGIRSAATCHCLRHSFATHLLEQGVHLGRIKSMLGHSSLKTTMIYLHTANDGIGNIPSPLDT
ncbi:MAG: tyrosine-type recombinase/integrase [Spirochaetales bacterium]|nr:tyrosine-type recombinase/integrase [Spirochaetales bacterium]